MILVLEEVLRSLGETLTPVAAWLALALSIWAAKPLPGAESVSLKHQLRRSREREFAVLLDRFDTQTGQREAETRALTERIDREAARREAETKASTERILTEMREAHQSLVAEMRQSIKSTVTELRESNRRGRAEARKIHERITAESRAIHERITAESKEANERIAAETRAMMAASDDRFRAQLQQTDTLLDQLSKVTERVTRTEATLDAVRTADYGAGSPPSPVGREPKTVAAQHAPADETSE